MKQLCRNLTHDYIQIIVFNPEQTKSLPIKIGRYIILVCILYICKGSAMMIHSSFPLRAGYFIF